MCFWAWEFTKGVACFNNSLRQQSTTACDTRTLAGQFSSTIFAFLFLLFSLFLSVVSSCAIWKDYFDFAFGFFTSKEHEFTYICTYWQHEYWSWCKICKIVEPIEVSATNINLRMHVRLYACTLDRLARGRKEHFSTPWEYWIVSLNRISWTYWRPSVDRQWAGTCLRRKASFFFFCYCHTKSNYFFCEAFSRLVGNYTYHHDNEND